MFLNWGKSTTRKKCKIKSNRLRNNLILIQLKINHSIFSHMSLITFRQITHLLFYDIRLDLNVSRIVTWRSLRFTVVSSENLWRHRGSWRRRSRRPLSGVVCAFETFELKVCLKRKLVADSWNILFQIKQEQYTFWSQDIRYPQH